VILPDVNIFVHAHRIEDPRHDACRRALDEVGPGDTLALTMPAINGFLRIVTHPGVFEPPTPMSLALQVVDEWASRANARWVGPGEGHFAVFSQLCLRYGAVGNAVYDLHLAALAVEHGAELLSLDAGFARVREIRWRSPVSP
jgi:toxin-antitoxin system PIN domain toxin